MTSLSTSPSASDPVKPKAPSSSSSSPCCTRGPSAELMRVTMASALSEPGGNTTVSCPSAEVRLPPFVDTMYSDTPGILTCLAVLARKSAVLIVGVTSSRSAFTAALTTEVM